MLSSSTGGLDILTRFAFTYFVLTPAIGGVFIAGFLAPRASWLLGLIVGLVGAICYSDPRRIGGLLPAGFAEVFATEPMRPSLAFIFSPIMGMLFASVAAWYRRFLQLSSPNRGRQQAAGASGAPMAGRSTSGAEGGRPPLIRR